MQVWQRNARLFVVAVAVTVSAAVFLTGRRREPPPAPRGDPARRSRCRHRKLRRRSCATSKVRRNGFAWKRGGSLTYSDGRTKLMDVKISVDRAGKIVRDHGRGSGGGRQPVQRPAHRQRAPDRQRRAGAGRRTRAPATARAEGIVRAPGPVTFSRGTMTGKGVDFTYDRNRDAIGLADQTVIRIAPDKKDTAGADIRGGRRASGAQGRLHELRARTSTSFAAIKSSMRSAPWRI